VTNRPDPVWSREAIESPCVRLCVVEPASRLCMGCLRSIDEIAAWTRMTAEERRRIMGELPGRAERIKPVRRGGRAARRPAQG
jgi:predicted Fe-S protein YdhL (DUF1289 family)